MTLIIVIAALSFLLVVQNVIHYRERRDMYNRLMAKDVDEYDRLNRSDSEKNKKTVVKSTLYNSIKRNYRRMYGEIGE